MRSASEGTPEKIGETPMKTSLFRSLLAAICIIVLTGTFLTPTGDAGWDKASSHIVTVNIYDFWGNYCRTIGYNYYVADTTTRHYKFNHRGPRVPNTHRYPHTAIITSTHFYVIDLDLDGNCDGNPIMVACYA